ncbi:hypothetical protein L6249_02880, partial [Candidatus Parcubacteria bacterium]|nr:hypothetical protein [Candidatus Parcubacteria bacterium]
GYIPVDNDVGYICDSGKNLKNTSAGCECKDDYILTDDGISCERVIENIRVTLHTPVEDRNGEIRISFGASSSNIYIDELLFEKVEYGNNTKNISIKDKQYTESNIADLLDSFKLYIPKNASKDELFVIGIKVEFKISGSDEYLTRYYNHGIYKKINRGDAILMSSDDITFLFYAAMHKDKWSWSDDRIQIIINTTATMTNKTINAEKKLAEKGHSHLSSDSFLSENIGHKFIINTPALFWNRVSHVFGTTIYKGANLVNMNDFEGNEFLIKNPHKDCVKFAQLKGLYFKPANNEMTANNTLMQHYYFEAVDDFSGPHDKLDKSEMWFFFNGGSIKSFSDTDAKYYINKNTSDSTGWLGNDGGHDKLWPISTETHFIRSDNFTGKGVLDHFRLSICEMNPGAYYINDCTIKPYFPL